jgi:hypothetical protein
LLRAELAALEQEDFDVGLIGFADTELARLLAAQDAAEGLTDEDAVPELPETPVSVSGDLWILGNHKLLVGDATKQSDIEKLMVGEPKNSLSNFRLAAWRGFIKGKLRSGGGSPSPWEGLGWRKTSNR